MKKIRIFLLLFSMNFLCVFTIAAEKKFSIENPSMLVERANQYIKEGGIYKTEENKQFSYHISKNLKLDDVYLTKIDYSLSHDYANLSYDLKDVKKGGNGNYDYNIFNIKVDKQGKCHFAGTGTCSDINRNRELVSSNDLEKILQKANQYITDNNIGKKDIRESSLEADPFQKKSDYIEKKIRNRIPEKISLDDLVLLNIKNVSFGKGVWVSYCIKATICEKSHRGSIKFKTISIVIDEKGNCHNNGFGDVSAGIGNSRSNFQSALNINQNELENIYEAVFKYMFKDTENWDKKINVRFLDLGYNNPLPDKFFERFKNEKIPVISPFKKCNDYKPDLFDGKYRPDGKDALFYSIDGIIEFDKTHVFVECSVMWAILAAREYIYTLEKKGGKWEVVEVEMGWIS